MRVEGRAHPGGELGFLRLDVGEGGHGGTLHPAPDERRAPGRRPQPAADSFARCLPMTMRWIWLVPSKICMTFASRM